MSFRNGFGKWVIQIEIGIAIEIVKDHITFDPEPDFDSDLDFEKPLRLLELALNCKQRKL